MALNSYFDFAENDFRYFKASYDAGIVANMMGAMAQGICEKYMKHLISEYYKPDDAMQQKDFENILRTHSLNRLMKFLKANMGAEFSKNTQTHMRMIDGFYFSTRYPGGNFPSGWQNQLQYSHFHNSFYNTDGIVSLWLRRCWLG